MKNTVLQDSSQLFLGDNPFCGKMQSYNGTELNSEETTTKVSSEFSRQIFCNISSY